jgi:L-ascorbate metabolism protein UlaG (beta-lactamase superfamily)
VQAGGFAAITDPVFSSSLGPGVRRWAPPGVAMAHLPPVDCCVVSHNHRDHLDLPSLRALGPQVTYVVPLGLGALLRDADLPRVVELDWWEGCTIEGRDGTTSARVTLVPAQHWSQRGPFDANQSLWGGFHLALEGLTAYFAGDTGYPAAFAEIGRRHPGIDFALLPIGAYEPRWFMSPQHMGPDDAVRAFDELGARFLVPMHWGTFRLTDEPMDEPPRVLRELMGGRQDRLIPLCIGQTHWAMLSSPRDG